MMKMMEEEEYGDRLLKNKLESKQIRIKFRNFLETFFLLICDQNWSLYVGGYGRF